MKKIELTTHDVTQKAFEIYSNTDPLSIWQDGDVYRLYGTGTPNERDFIAECAKDELSDTLIELFGECYD